MAISDHIAVITGASKGLGKELALQLANEGYNLALVARSEKELKEVANSIKLNGVDCEYYVCDVTKPEQITNTFQNILEHFKRIDILINNAGVYFEGPTESTTPETIKEIFEVNVQATILSSINVLPQMKKQKTGQILNVISIAGTEPPGSRGEYSVYTSSKYAVRGFTQALEEELNNQGYKIKVMDFCPEAMDTEIFKAAGFNYSFNEGWMMHKEDIAKIAVYMLKQPVDVTIDHVVIRKTGKNL